MKLLHMETGTGLNRLLQVSGSTCNFFSDIERNQFRCTLEGYCEALNAAAAELGVGGGSASCGGDLEGDYSIIFQDKGCIEPGSETPSWIQGFQRSYRVCYVYSERSDFFKTSGVRQTSNLAFYEGFTFDYRGEAKICADNSNQQCSCVASLDGRPCRSCQVCNDGFLVGESYLAALDCTNIAEGLTRTCDPTFSWGDFYELVEESNFASLVSQPTDPSSIPTQSPMAAPKIGTEKGIVEDANPSTPNDKGLSVTELIGILGSACGIALALILAVVLVVVLRRNGSSRRKESNDSNENTNPRDTTEAPETDEMASPRPIMASQVVLMDEQRESGLRSPGVPSNRNGKPQYKNQFRA